MDGDARFQRLIGQLLSATDRACQLRAERRPAGMADGVVLSLRLTLAYLLQRRGVLDPEAVGFSCVVDEGGALHMRWAGRLLPVDAGFVRFLFQESGVELEPGQVLVLHPGFAMTAVEHALAELILKEASAREERRLLTAAHRRLMGAPVTALGRRP